MMGSPMVLIFILPLVAIEYLFSGELFEIDISDLFNSFLAWCASPERETEMLEVLSYIEELWLSIA